MCREKASSVAVFITSATGPEATERLITHALGPEAWQYYRSPERVFPLRNRGEYYSLSHTQGVTAIATATTPIGIDVECRLSKEATIDLGWALSPKEFSELALNGENRLTEIWTAKEAAGKALGVGLGAAPGRIITQPIHHEPGFRASKVPLEGSDSTDVLTYGWWHEERHIRIAWPMQDRQSC